VPVRAAVRRHREEVPEQLVGAVDQVDVHAREGTRAAVHRGYVTNTWV
jgi:hypothetical protein